MDAQQLSGMGDEDNYLYAYTTIRHTHKYNQVN